MGLGGTGLGGTGLGGTGVGGAGLGGAGLEGVGPGMVACAVFVAILLVLCPLPFGSVTEGWGALLGAAAFVAAAAALIAVRELGRLRAVVVPLLSLCLMALLGAFQAGAWPMGMIRVLSPGHYDLFSTAESLLEGTTQSVRPSLSVAPGASLLAALVFLAVAAAVLAAGAVATDRRLRRLLGGAVVATALFEVLFGARLWFAEATTIWGVDVPSDAGRLRGTYVNPDHLALYLEIALALVLAWGWWSWRRARRQDRPHRAVLLVAPPALVWLLLFVGLAFTGSRAGLVAGVVGVTAQGLLFATQRRGRRRMRWMPVGVVLASLGLGAVAFVGFEAGFGRWMDTSAYEITANHRNLAYGATLELWQRFPWLGSGLGTFEEAFPLVEPAELGAVRWTHAHNDWLELLATTGLVGALLAGVGLIGIVLRLGRVLTDGVRSEDRAAGLAALGAVVAVGIHEALDFGLTIPANAFTMAVVVGACLTARTRSTRPPSRPH